MTPHDTALTALLIFALGAALLMGAAYRSERERSARLTAALSAAYRDAAVLEEEKAALEEAFAQALEALERPCPVAGEIDTDLLRADTPVLPVPRWRRRIMN